MLDSLKDAIRKNENSDFLLEAATASRSVRDAFLEDFSSTTIGAEDDPEIKTLIQAIPEYNEGDPELEEQLNEQALIESYVPETEIL